jgi:hypothetical protein
MQALAVIIIYVLTAAMLQGIGFLISRIVSDQWPPAGTMTFLILFLGAFFVGWPIAVRIAEWAIRRSGHSVETEQSGGAGRLDHLPRRRP